MTVKLTGASASESGRSLSQGARLSDTEEIDKFSFRCLSPLVNPTDGSGKVRANKYFISLVLHLTNVKLQCIKSSRDHAWHRAMAQCLPFLGIPVQ